MITIDQLVLFYGQNNTQTARGRQQIKRKKENTCKQVKERTFNFIKH